VNWPALQRFELYIEIKRKKTNYVVFQILLLLLPATEPVTQHLFFEGPFLLNLYAEKSLTMNNFDIASVFESEIIVEIVKIIYSSPVCSLL
jgi:hypothetical protein